MGMRSVGGVRSFIVCFRLWVTSLMDWTRSGSSIWIGGSVVMASFPGPRKVFVPAIHSLLGFFGYLDGAANELYNALQNSNTP